MKPEAIPSPDMESDDRLALDVDLVPYEDHCLLAALADSKYSSETIDRIEYAYRDLLGAADRRDPGLLILPPNERPMEAIFGWAVQDWKQANDAVGVMLKILRARMVFKALFPRIPRHFFRAALAEIKAEQRLRDQNESSRSFAADKAKLPSEYQGALKRLETAVGRKPDKARSESLGRGSKNNFEGNFLRFWGAQLGAGVALHDFAPNDLLTARHIDNYLAAIHRERRPWNDARCLTALRRAAHHVLPGANLAALTEKIEQLREEFPDPRREGARKPHVGRSCLLDQIPADELRRFNEAMAMDAFDFVDFESDRKFRTLEPSTRASREYTFRSFHGTLIRLAPDLHSQPFAERDYPRAVDIFCEDLARSSRGRTIAARLHDLKYILERMFFPKKFDFIGALAAELIAADPCGGPDIPKITTDDLRRTGHAIVAEAWRRLDDLRKVPADRRYRPIRPLAELYRNGLVLVVLSYAPLRLADLSTLMNGVSIKWRKTNFVLSVRTRKTGKPRFVVLPATLNPIVKRYLDIVRHEIGDADPSVMWVSREGGALTPSAFQRIVPKMTLEHCGTRIYCHLLRHIRATNDVASTDPHKGSKSLGHLHLNTAQRKYRRREVDWETVVEMERVNHNEDDPCLGPGETARRSLITRTTSTFN